MFNIFKFVWLCVSQPETVVREHFPQGDVRHGALLYLLLSAHASYGTVLVYRRGIPWLNISDHLVIVTIGIILVCLYQFVIYYFIHPRIVARLSDIPREMFDYDLARKLYFFSIVPSVAATVVLMAPYRIVNECVAASGASTVVVTAFSFLGFLLAPVNLVFWIIGILLVWKGYAAHFRLESGPLVIAVIVLPIIYAIPIVIGVAIGVFIAVFTHMPVIPKM